MFNSSRDDLELEKNRDFLYFFKGKYYRIENVDQFIIYKVVIAWPGSHEKQIVWY